MQGQAYQRRRESWAADGSYGRLFATLVERTGADPARSCVTAWGPNADRRTNSLNCPRKEGSTSEADSHKKEVFAEAKGEGFDVKVLREILRLRKQDKDERDDRSPCLTCISEPWRAPARRRQRRRSAKPATNFRLLKEVCSHRFNLPSMNSTVGRGRQAEAIRRASTSVAAPRRCELLSRWPSSGPQGPRAACLG
jgi:hypothetical protein